MIFFFKKKRWAVIFNVIQNSAIFLFFIYAFFYTIFKGNTDNLSAMLALLVIIVFIDVLYFFIIKKYYRYFVYLKKH